VSEDFFGWDSERKEFRVSGKYFYLVFFFLLFVLVVAFVYSTENSEKQGFARGYACAFDNLKEGFSLSNTPESQYCNRFHKAFIEQKNIQAGWFE